MREYCCISFIEDVCRGLRERFMRDWKVVLGGYVTPIIILEAGMSAKGPLG